MLPLLPSLCCKALAARQACQRRYRYRVPWRTSVFLILLQARGTVNHYSGKNIRLNDYPAFLCLLFVSFPHRFKNPEKIPISHRVQLFIRVSPSFQHLQEIARLCLIGNAPSTWGIQIGTEGSKCLPAQIIIEIISQSQVADSN